MYAGSGDLQIREILIEAHASNRDSLSVCG
jgi:hypothetical protein